MPRVRVSQEDINRNRLLDAGSWYPVEILNIYDEQSSKGDSMNTIVDMKVISGAFTGAFLRRVFNEKAPGMMIPFLKVFVGEVLPDQDYDLDALTGRQLKVFVKHREWNGQMFNDVVDFRPLE